MKNTERRAKGVIGCLTAGFEMLPQNLQVAALPMVLDFVLWLGPRVSIEPILGGGLSLLTSARAGDAEMTAQIEQAVALVREFGERFNLLTLLGSTPMVQVPSLMARHAPATGTPLGAPQILSLTSALALIPWWAVLTAAGLVLGFLYLNEIAHQVRGGAGTNPGPMGSSLRAGAGKLARFLLFSGGVLVGVLLILPVWATMVTLAGALFEPLAILLWVGGVGFFGYAALHLVFVIPSLLLGERPLGRAIGESLLLSHAGLPSVLGFVLLTVVIYEGLGYAWALPRSDSWAMAVGIMGNGFVATGLTAAAFEFYRDRLMLTHRLIAEAAEE